MFRLLGTLVRRTWLGWLIGWGALLLVVWLAAPPWDDVAEDKEFGFLPDGVPTHAAEAMFAKAFPDDQSPSNIVLVLHRSTNDRTQRAEDLKFIADTLEPGLRKIADESGGLAGQLAPSDDPLFADTPTPKPTRQSIMARIRTPNAVGKGAFLESEDGQALMVVIDLTTEFLTRDNWPTIEKVRGLLKSLRKQGKIPQGLEIALTGSAVIGQDHTQAQVQSAHNTELLTVILVVVLLLLIYRAPLLSLIPLATVFLAVQVSLKLLAILAGMGYVTLFQGIEIYVIILAYGAGVDYCLFLTARYKEELELGTTTPAEGVERAVGNVGAAISASAATVIIGIAMMMFAEFGKFRQAGFAIPFSLTLLLFATLTFTPSLLRLAGYGAFWPRPLRKGRGNNGGCPPTERRPLRFGNLTRFWDGIGRLLVRKPGTVWLVTAGVMAPFAIAAGFLFNRLSYDVIENLPESAPSVAGSRLLQEHFPAGMIGTTTVLIVNPRVDFGGPAGHKVVEQITDELRKHREEFDLADVRSLTAPLGITPRVQAEGAQFSDAARREAAERVALDHYATSLGERNRIGTRLELTFSNSPFSRASIDALKRVEQAIQKVLPGDAASEYEVYSVGTTASVRDLAAVMASDRLRIELLVLGSVFVVLILLLRRLVVTLYLLLTVLFSYLVTLGVTFLVFWLLDPQGFVGVDWKVAIFLFTILIAVGEDYNIFLLTRVDEETARHGPIRGVTCALTRTGPIISSCGIIMAGTFASLMSGTLSEMKQLGFALAFGVLLDTFIVRPILVPAFLILLGSGRFHGWVGRGSAKEEKHQESEPLPMG